MTILASLALAATAGCDLGTVGDGGGGILPPPQPAIPDPPDDPNAGLNEFNVGIKAMVSGCAGTGVGCHTGTETDPAKFLGVGPDSGYYEALVSSALVHGNWNLATAALVTKLDQDAAAVGSHYGMTPWSDEQKAKLGAWFDLERHRLGDTGPVMPNGQADTRYLRAQWAGCMDLATWEATNMGEWTNKGSNEGPCQSCHNDCQFWFCANPDSTAMFQANRTELFIDGFFAAQMNPDGTGEIVAAYDKLVRMGSGEGNSLHPRFNTNLDDQYFQYLTEFTAATMQRMADGLCGPAEFQPL